MVEKRPRRQLKIMKDGKTEFSMQNIEDIPIQYMLQVIAAHRVMSGFKKEDMSSTMRRLVTEEYTRVVTEKLEGFKKEQE